MANPTVFDLVEGHSVNRIFARTEIRRIARIDGLTAAPEQQMLEALAAPDMPQLGDQYPGEPAWVLTETEATPNGPNAARVQLYYTNKVGPTWNQPPPPVPGTPGLDVKQFSGSFSRRKTTQDNTGSPMLLATPTKYAGWPAYLSEAEVNFPVGVLGFERTENEPPADTWRTYGSTLNQSAIGSYAALTLLFSRLSAQSDDGGRTWRCTYEFQWDPNGWQHEDSYKGPDGKVTDVSTPVTWDVLFATEFSGLGLDFSDSQTPL